MVAEMQQQLVKAQIALERDYEVQREYDTRFRVLMESATESFVLSFLRCRERSWSVNSAAAATPFRSQSGRPRSAPNSRERSSSRGKSKT